MQRFRLPLLLAGLFGLAVLVLVPASPAARAEEDSAAEARAAAAARPDVFPVADVRPGMRGHGITVKAATRLERFEIEVVDVIRHFLAGQDVVLIRCLGDEFAHHGVAEGMSGSPIYLDGRLLGALAYTWGWSKDALGGVTPIEAMLAEGQRPLEDRPSGAEPTTPLRAPRPAAAPADPSRELTPIATPLCLGGFTAEGRARAAEALAPLGFAVRAAGGGLVAGAPAGGAQLDAPLLPGSALSVDLVRGDLSVAALGTCTFVDGDRVHAFGHDFQSMGETLFPMSVGYVYTVVASRNMSFKLGASLREVGAIVQDRPSGIVGILGRKAPMVPFEVITRNEKTGYRRTFRFEVTANKSVFQRMVILALREAIAQSEGTLGYNTKRFRIEVQIQGVEEPWIYEDAFVSFDSGFSRILIGLVDRVLNHPTQRAAFESVKLDVSYENVDRRAFIETVTADREEVRRGESVDLEVRMRLREGGAIVTETLSFKVPSTAPAGNFVVQIAGGDEVAADIAAPVDVLDIPTLYDAFLKSTELVAVVPTGRVNLDIDGRLFRNLPLSAIPRIVRSPEAAGVRLQQILERVRKPVPHIVAGRGQAVLRVLP